MSENGDISLSSVEIFFYTRINDLLFYDHVGMMFFVYCCRYSTLDTVDIAQLMLPMFLGAAFSSVSLSALVLVRQRENKVTHSLRLAGLSPAEFWIAQILFDVAFGLVLVAAAVCCVFAFSATWFQGGERLGAFVLVLVLGVAAVAVMGYALSACFSSSATAARILPIAVMALTIMPFVNHALSLLLITLLIILIPHCFALDFLKVDNHVKCFMNRYLVAWILQSDASAETQATGRTLGLYLNVIPTIAIQNGISGIMAHAKKFPGSASAATTAENAALWDMDNGVAPSVIASAAVILVAALWLLVEQVLSVINCRTPSSTPRTHPDKKMSAVDATTGRLTGDSNIELRDPNSLVNDDNENNNNDMSLDPLVEAETQKALEFFQASHRWNNSESLADASAGDRPQLVVSGLTKRYKAGGRPALKNLSLVVPPHELMVRVQVAGSE